MICYRDTTFCASKVEKHTCGRELSERDRKRANDMGIPIAWGEFCVLKTSAEPHEHIRAESPDGVVATGEPADD